MNWEEECRSLRCEVRELRAMLDPFAEIAKRLGWADFAEDDQRLNDHIIEAPADDIAPGAFYCLMISSFRRAALANAQK